MGYTIKYSGSFDLNKPLTKKLAKYLLDFSRTRHFKRDLPDFGIEGEFFIDPTEKKINFWDNFQKYAKVGLTHEEVLVKLREECKIIDYNHPPISQPGLWCQWIPTEDRSAIKWDENEKFYNADKWLTYIIENFLKPKGYILDGIVSFHDSGLDEYQEEYGYIVVKDNKVIVKY